VESHLEQRFRKNLVERLVASGASVHETPGPWGNTVRVTVPGGRRQWTLTPQEHIEGCRPDFVLRSSDTTVPTVVIFTDGRAYHATESINRLADDATKREILRDSGYMVRVCPRATCGPRPRTSPLPSGSRRTLSSN